MTKMVQTTENETRVIPFQATEAEPPAVQGHYEAVRFNAMKHGILIHHTVLAHEDADEYRALLAALVEKHQPAGATEAHPVEDLAGIIWHNRREQRPWEKATRTRGKGFHLVAKHRGDHPWVATPNDKTDCHGWNA